MSRERPGVGAIEPQDAGYGHQVTEIEWGPDERAAIWRSLPEKDGRDAFIDAVAEALTEFFMFDGLRLETRDENVEAFKNLDRLQKALSDIEDVAKNSEGVTLSYIEQAIYLKFRRWWGLFDTPDTFEANVREVRTAIRDFVRDHKVDRSRGGAPKKPMNLRYWRRVARLYSTHIGETPSTASGARFVRVAESIARVTPGHPNRDRDVKPHDVRSMLKKAEKLDKATWGKTDEGG